MSYYPTERRGGCMESITRCCRQAYVYPLDTRKLLYAGGAVVGVILIAVIWSGLSSTKSSYVQPFKGSQVLRESPLVVGSNFFAVNLRNLVQNNISRVNFDHNLTNDSLFGNANCKSCQTDIARLQSGLVGSQVWSLRVPCNAEYKDAVALTLEQVDAMSRLLASYPGNVTFVKESAEMQGRRTDALGGLLAVSSGHSFDGRMSVLRTLYSLGVRVMALNSNCSTAWSSSFNDTDASNDYGLTNFGVAVVREMNRLGMLIDLSEASHKTQLDVLNITKAPVVFTRAAAFGVVNNTRNIKDDVLLKLKENNGLVMVTFAAQYLNSNTSNVSISDVIKHLNYMKNKTGEDKVGIGAEFDAQEETYPASLNDVSTFPALFDSLGDEKWSEDSLKKLAGQNFLRVLQEVEKVAKESASLPADESFMLQIKSGCYSDYEARSKGASAVTTGTTNLPTTTVTVETTKVTDTTVPTSNTLTTPTTQTTSTATKTQQTTASNTTNTPLNKATGVKK